MSPLRLIRRPAEVDGGPAILTWQPVSEPWEFTKADVAREAVVLDRLAAETARTNSSWTAATHLFGGRP